MLKKITRKDVIEMVAFIFVVSALMIIGALIYNTEVPAYPVN